MLVRLFETEFNFDVTDEFDDEYYGDPLPSLIEMCGYTWSKIGEIYGHSLYLCDDIVRNMKFSENRVYDWKKSDIYRWLNTDLYREIPSEYKYRIVKHNDDNLFLLSNEEYEKFKRNITNIHMFWWLRSPGSTSSSATIVDIDGRIFLNGYHMDFCTFGVRPALLLR